MLTAWWIESERKEEDPQELLASGRESRLICWRPGGRVLAASSMAQSRNQHPPSARPNGYGAVLVTGTPARPPVALGRYCGVPLVHIHPTSSCLRGRGPGTRYPRPRVGSRPRALIGRQGCCSRHFSARALEHHLDSSCQHTPAIGQWAQNETRLGTPSCKYYMTDCLLTTSGIYSFAQVRLRPLRHDAPLLIIPNLAHLHAAQVVDPAAQLAVVVKEPPPVAVARELGHRVVRRPPPHRR